MINTLLVKKKKALKYKIILGLLGTMIPFLLFGLILFIFAAMLGGIDYEGGISENNLIQNSEINFFFADKEINHTVLNLVNAFEYIVGEEVTVTESGDKQRNTILKAKPIPGIQIRVKAADIISPIDGIININSTTNSYYVQNDNETYYIHGNLQLLVSPNTKVKKGDIIARANGVLSMSVKAEETNWEWSTYYPEYYYWLTRKNVFPLLAPPDKIIYTYTSLFGNRSDPFTKEVSYHNAVDIAVPVWTTVLAVEDGVIEKAGKNDASGIYVVLVSKDNKRRYSFLHLTSILAKEGTEVEKGQKIALSGNTGRSTGPHLHFGMYSIETNEYIDPYPGLKHWEKNMNYSEVVEKEIDTPKNY